MSDDYIFDDDIVLDEDALAILDAEESKYFGSLALANGQSDTRPAPSQPTPPPAKRRRTDDDGGWKHTTTNTTTTAIGIAGGSGSGKPLTPQLQKRSDSFYEGLPDISLAGDGVYGVYSQGSQPPQSSSLASSTKNMKNPLGQRSQSTGFQQPVHAPAPVPAPIPAPVPLPRERTTANVNQNRPPPRHPLPPQPQRTHTPPSNIPRDPNNSNRPQPQQQYRQQPPPHPHPQQQHKPNQITGQVQKAGSVPPQPNRPQNLGPGRNVNVPRQQQFRPSNVTNATDKDLQDEVAKLRAQLEQVRMYQTVIFRYR